jgi:hypothetical protein
MGTRAVTPAEQRRSIDRLRGMIEKLRRLNDQLDVMIAEAQLPPPGQPPIPIVPPIPPPPPEPDKPK